MTLPGDWYWRRYHPEHRKEKEIPALPKDNTYSPHYTPVPITEEEEKEEEEGPPPEKE